MKTVTGYLDSVVNPNFSGIATVGIRTNKNPRKGKRVSTYCEAGYGVRRLVDAFSVDGRRFSKTSGEIKARFAIDEFGMLAGVSLLGQEED